MKFIEKLLLKNLSDKTRAIDIGALGENEAVRILKKHGYKIIERNFSTRFGEIDIIAKDKDYICFVEVRLRKRDNFGSPLETVDKNKQRRIIRAAKIYVSAHRLFDEPMRFDVVGINADVKGNKLFNVNAEVIKNAFELQGF